MSRDELAEVMLAHQALDYDAIVGSYDCECGVAIIHGNDFAVLKRWELFAAHQADMVLACIQTKADA